MSSLQRAREQEAALVELAQKYDSAPPEDRPAIRESYRELHARWLATKSEEGERDVA
jgi:hypothetical protein